MIILTLHTTSIHLSPTMLNSFVFEFAFLCCISLFVVYLGVRNMPVSVITYIR